MTTEEFLLKLLHIALASTWFGASWLAGWDIRHTVELGPPHTDALTVRIRRLELVAIPSALLAFVTGILLAVSIYGFARIPVRLWCVVGFAVLTMCVGGFFASPEWRKARSAITENDFNAATHHARRFERFLWLEHALRLVMLAFVVWRDAPH